MAVQGLAPFQVGSLPAGPSSSTPSTPQTHHSLQQVTNERCAFVQEWPPELEAALQSSRLPTADLVSTTAARHSAHAVQLRGRGPALNHAMMALQHGAVGTQERQQLWSQPSWSCTCSRLTIMRTCLQRPWPSSAATDTHCDAVLFCAAGSGHCVLRQAGVRAVGRASAQRQHVDRIHAPAVHAVPQLQEQSILPDAGQQRWRQQAFVNSERPLCVTLRRLGVASM